MTQAIETVPVGVVQLPEPCWELVYARTGEEWDGGEVFPHFADQSEAESYAASLDDEPPLTTRRVDARCITASAACGAPLEDDNGALLCFSAVEELLREARDYGWSVRDGVLRCEDGDDCQPETTKE